MPPLPQQEQPADKLFTQAPAAQPSTPSATPPQAPSALGVPDYSAQVTPETLKSVLDRAPEYGWKGDRSVQASAWDAWHAAKTPEDFRKAFDAINLPRQTKAALWDLKFQPPIEPGKTVETAQQAAAAGLPVHPGVAPTQLGRHIPGEERFGAYNRLGQAIIHGLTAPGTLFGGPTTEEQQAEQALQQGLQESRAYIAQHPEAAAQEGPSWAKFKQLLSTGQAPPPSPGYAAATPHLQAWERGQLGPTISEQFRPIPMQPTFSMQAATGAKPGTVGGGAAEAISGLTSPESLAQLATVPASKLFHLAFTGQMSWDTVKALAHAGERYAVGDDAGAKQALGGAGVSAIMTALSLLGLGKPEEGVRPGVRPETAQPGVAPAPEVPQRPQAGPPAAPNLGVEGGPQPPTSPGQTGAQEVTGGRVPAAASAPIEGGGGTTGTVTPKPTELPQASRPSDAEWAEDFKREFGHPPTARDWQVRQEQAGQIQQKIGEARAAGVLPDLRKAPGVPRAEGERRQFLKSPEQVQREAAEMEAEHAAQQEAKRQAWEKSERERQAALGPMQPGARPQPEVTHIDDAIRNAQDLVQRARAAGDKTTVQQAEGLLASLQKKKLEVQGAQRPTGVPETPTAAAPQPAAEPVRPRPEEPAYQAGEPVRPQPEPVREPVRPGAEVAPSREQARAGNIGQLLQNPELMQGAVQIPGSPEPAIPVGGARKSGAITQEMSWKRANDVRMALQGREGFPNPRLFEVRPNVYEVHWGEEMPWRAQKAKVPAADWARKSGQAFGYKPESVEGLASRLAPGTPRPERAGPEELAKWTAQRQEQAAARAGAMAEAAPPRPADRAEAAAKLDRTLTRTLKPSEADEARIPGGRKRELDAAIERERAKGPEAAEKAARQMLNRAGRAQSYIESLNRLRKALEPGPEDEMGRPTPSWDQTLREALHDTSLRMQVDPNTGREIPVYKWVTKEGVQGGTRAPARSRAIDAITAEIYNDLRGNKMKEVGLKRVKELDEAGQATLAEQQKQYRDLIQEVRRQPGSRPTDEQLTKLKGLMQGIHGLRQTRMIAVGGPGSEIGAFGEQVPKGTGTPRAFLNEVMGWPEGTHLSKPTPERLTARIGELQREMEAARDVAKRLRAGTEPGAVPAAPAPKAPEPKAPEAPKPAPAKPAAPTGTQADAVRNGQMVQAAYEKEGYDGLEQHSTEVLKSALESPNITRALEGAIKNELADRELSQKPAVQEAAKIAKESGEALAKATEEKRARLTQEAAEKAKAEKGRQELERMVGEGPKKPELPKGYGEKNKGVTKSEADEIRKRLLRKYGTEAPMGIDPTVIPDVAKLIAYHIEAGTRAFADVSARLVSEMGEWVRPYLQPAWDSLHGRGAGEAPKTPAVAPGKPVEPSKPAGRPETPTGERGKLEALRKEVAGRIAADPHGADAAQYRQLLKQIDAKLGTEPAKPAAAKPVTKPVTKAPDTLRRAEVRGYRTGEKRAEPALTSKPVEPEAPKGPSAQKRISDAFRDGRGLKEFTSEELRQAATPLEEGGYKVGAETLKAIDAELKAREAERPEIAKIAPKQEAAVQAPKKEGHVAVSVAHPDDPELPTVFGKHAFARETLHKLGQRVDKLPKGEDRNDVARSLNTVSEQFENMNKQLRWLGMAINDMRESGETVRTRVPKSGPRAGQKVTETLTELENRQRRLGLDRSKLEEEEITRLKDTLGALEAKPVEKAPAPTPTEVKPTVVKTYGSEEVLDEQGRYVGKTAPLTGAKIVTPSPAPTEEGVQQRLDVLGQHKSDLAKLVNKYGGTPPRKAAMVMQQLRKGIAAIRATLPKGVQEPARWADPILEGGKILTRAAAAEPRPVPEGKIVEAKAKGYVSGAPIIGSTDEMADNLHSWLQGKKESIPTKVMGFIDKTLFTTGEAGNHIAKPILESLAKGEFGDLKSDEAPMKAALRLQKALDVLQEGRIRSLAAPKEMTEGMRPEDTRSSIRTKAFSDALHVAKTGVVPVPKPPKSGQEGFFSLGRRGRAAVPPTRAAQVSRNAIGRLAKTVEALPASRGMDRRIEQAMRAGAQAVPTTPGTFAQAYQRTVTLTKTLVNAFKQLPKWQDFQKAIGDFRLIRTRQAYESRNFVRNIQEKLGVPSLLRQTLHPIESRKDLKAANLRLEAITNYLEADGDATELARRASLSSAKVRPGYELAANLNPEEKAIAQAIKEHFEQRARDGLALGILHGYVENYAPHIWKDKGHLASISAELNSGILNRNFKFAMQRIYGSYFEGEQRGLSPKIKRIDALVAIHDNAFNTAMNTRLLARQLMDGTAADGRPILAFNTSGAIKLTGGQRLDPVTLRMIRQNPAVLLKPNSRPFDPNLDMRGYKKIDAAAFQKWIWKGQEGGKNILMQGDAWVHPDHVRELKNLVGKSAIREFTLGGLPVGEYALIGNAALKQVQLGAIGAFHYAQEGLHDVWHFRNPLHPDNWTGKRLDQAMTDHVVLDGIRHGLNLYEGGADFGDGGALLDRIPGLGKYIRASTDHLFQSFIPSLKADLYKHVLEKNLSHYAKEIRQGKIDHDQLKVISARTVNNAFGELDTITRNKTFQDVLKLTLLAPDFLEARARFLGQAARPHGWVPFTAMMRNIGLLYAGARVLNYAVNKDPLWDGKYWDGVKIGDKIYRVRSITGDLFHAISNSESFAYWRLSPYMRPIIAKMATVRKGIPYRLKDIIADTVPIGLQGEAKKIIYDNVKDPDVSRSIWETIGVREERYFSPEQRKMLERRSEERERVLRGEKRQGLGPMLPSLPRIK